MTISENNRNLAFYTVADKSYWAGRVAEVLKTHPEGSTDREIATILNIPCSIVSARRNGLNEAVRASGSRTYFYGKRNVRATVWVWNASPELFEVKPKSNKDKLKEIELILKSDIDVIEKIKQVLK